MKLFFELCYNKHPEEWITKKDMRILVMHDEGNIFGWMDFDKRADQTKFALKISKFIGRVLSDVRMVVDDSKVRSSRQRFKFTKKDTKPEKFDFDENEKGSHNHPKLNEVKTEVTTLLQGN